MGLYHNVYLVYGAPITKNEMNPNLLENAEKLYNDPEVGGIELWMFYNGENRWLISSSEEIEPNEFTGVGSQFIAHEAAEERAEKVRKFADRLDVEIGWPSWYVLHDYS